MNKFVGKVTVVEVLIWVLLIAVLIFTITPIIFMITASFMDAKQILAMPFSWIPSKEYFTSADRTFFTNFHRAIMGNNDNPTFFRNLFNSLVVAITDSFTTVFLASLCGYGLAKFRFRGRNLIFISIMSTMMIPFEAIMIPLYMVVSGMDMINTYRGMIIPFMVSAFGVFQMRQYLLTFPSEYLDAARVDGVSEPGIYAKIVIPNSKPVIATLGILSFRNQWDNLLWPLLVAQSEAMKTIPQYITKFSEEKMTDEGAMMACAFLASIPMFILFFTLSRYFLGGAAVYDSRKG
ncbi:MAG: carbohydrate ABC transporter permease [Spirochaetes bacterium]|uniref:sn-glycerol-3-phosphate transport system permease protein UgpE n=1 Tax=Candidatus Ornithospirochaeta stercoripullorum TaxID=2840899 RepID=A0A9D9E4P8_9SPIO|nr:carbohydrate ABC transporter permease [Candidatus Ornithospirochaeta stercoripullorum]